MRVLAFALMLVATPALVHSQITSENLHKFVPQMPKLVTQTDASEALNLYGNRASAMYVDADENGIDDRRQIQLHRIAERFSPILRRNNFSFPRDFKKVLGTNDVLFVYTYSAGRLVKSDTLRLGWSQAPPEGARALDSALAVLLAVVDPTLSVKQTISADDYEDKIRFVDYPGSDPRSWREAYQKDKQKEAALYTHFFIHADTAARGDARYYIVAQNWFFYPFDDAANNHEGDWEHMNVLITTMDAAKSESRGRLTAEEVARVLDGDTLRAQSLVIAFVDYYFHENVFTLSYMRAYQKADTAREPWIKRKTVWREPEYINNTMLQRIASEDGALATHPIGYIGGNNKGPDELFSIWPRFAKAYNRNGHGTYAFPGTWQSVGAIASTEQISGRAIPRLYPGGSRDEPLVNRIADPMFVAFAAENITVVPDWERVNSLFVQSARARRDWGWLVIPMRWGFPAAASPGGGALAHTDVGNISPEGPAFQPTWNRIGSADGWREYTPEALSVMLAPTTPWDKLKSGWGILNVPVALIGFIPGWNVAVTQVMPWVSETLHLFGAETARTFRPANSNLRFSTMSVGIAHQFGGDDFALLLDSAGKTTTDATNAMTQANAFRFGLQVYYGPRLSVEMTAAGRDRRISATRPNGGFSDVVSASIETWDVNGGFRYDIQPTLGPTHAFVRVGWGWADYTVKDIVWTEKDVIIPSDSLAVDKGGYMVTWYPSEKWWPNSWYGGAGVEWFAPQRAWLIPQVGYGIRAELTASRHKLGSTKPGDPNQGLVSRYEAGISLVIGW